MTRDEFMKHAEQEIEQAFRGQRNRMMNLVEQAWAEGKRNAEVEAFTEAGNELVNVIKKELFPKLPTTITTDKTFPTTMTDIQEPYMDYDGQDVWRCGSCGATLFHLSHTQADENEQNCVRFCRYCGKAVKWDADAAD